MNKKTSPFIVSIDKIEEHLKKQQEIRRNHPHSGICPITKRSFTIRVQRWGGEMVIGGEHRCSECGTDIGC